ncbi:unnamed protein product [Vitrella brassicaformis CCMP3155]|uniref:Uncharacterized protein n=2 Tax=Vitrella brassicaformis TaxID=1169539 RepID=A0A0G4G9R2_VITBC|nr:unnamed protein product [Vitrella brassicaformis CCMP3155]|mmetsp:Transcript_10045/g.29016  ORF Transcript_10045/g.29016 Transcript_10045/m.29016 type:complete len:741 (-) Transcript_10045:1616-3838(-)|eukprot:CEM25757.1 unnamed protein product [Vitrella brassicaformis CCMP3155]
MSSSSRHLSEAAGGTDGALQLLEKGKKGTKKLTREDLVAPQVTCVDPVQFVVEDNPVEREWYDHKKSEATFYRGKFSANEEAFMMRLFKAQAERQQMAWADFVTSTLQSIKKKVKGDADNEQADERLDEGPNIFLKLAGHFPHRTTHSVRNRAVRMLQKANPSIKKGRWSADEVSSLLSLQRKYQRDWKGLASELNRTPDAVRDKFRELQPAYFAAKQEEQANHDDAAFVPLAILGVSPPARPKKSKRKDRRDKQQQQQQEEHEGPQEGEGDGEGEQETAEAGKGRRRRRSSERLLSPSEEELLLSVIQSETGYELQLPLCADIKWLSVTNNFNQQLAQLSRDEAQEEGEAPREAPILSTSQVRLVYNRLYRRKQAFAPENQPNGTSVTPLRKRRARRKMPEGFRMLLFRQLLRYLSSYFTACGQGPEILTFEEDDQGAEETGEGPGGKEGGGEAAWRAAVDSVDWKNALPFWPQIDSKRFFLRKLQTKKMQGMLSSSHLSRSPPAAQVHFLHSHLDCDGHADADTEAVMAMQESSDKMLPGVMDGEEGEDAPPPPPAIADHYGIHEQEDEGEGQQEAVGKKTKKKKDKRKRQSEAVLDDEQVFEQQPDDGWGGYGDGWEEEIQPPELPEDNGGAKRKRKKRKGAKAAAAAADESQDWDGWEGYHQHKADDDGDNEDASALPVPSKHKKRKKKERPQSDQLAVPVEVDVSELVAAGEAEAAEVRPAKKAKKGSLKTQASC